MRRFGRWVFNGLVAVSLVLFVATVLFQTTYDTESVYESQSGVLIPENVPVG